MKLGTSALNFVSVRDNVGVKRFQLGAKYKVITAHQYQITISNWTLVNGCVVYYRKELQRMTNKSRVSEMLRNAPGLADGDRSKKYRSTL